jgi:hypothetical protein
MFFVDNDEHTTTDGKRCKSKSGFMLNLNKVSCKNYRADSEIKKAIELLMKLKAIEITSIEKELRTYYQNSILKG